MVSGDSGNGLLSTSIRKRILMNKEITIALNKRVKQLIAKCPQCGGCGISSACNKCPQGPSEQKCSERFDTLICDRCPTCADLRKLEKELCWHEIVNTEILPDGMILTCSCGEIDNLFNHDKFNPVYKIQSLRPLLERMGEWEKFVRYCGESVVIRKSERKPCPVNGEINWVTFDYAGMQIKFANILTSDELMAQVVYQYLKGAE